MRGYCLEDTRDWLWAAEEGVYVFALGVYGRYMLVSCRITV
jgi:hypothetical protein